MIGAMSSVSVCGGLVSTTKCTAKLVSSIPPSHLLSDPADVTKLCLSNYIFNRSGAVPVHAHTVGTLEISSR